jgi:outer membrane protein with beta-barrel domain
MRTRHGIIPAVLLLVLVFRAPEVRAAAEVHRLNVVLSAVPTQLRATDFNNVIGDVNRTVLVPRGLAPLSKISLSWMFDAEVRYFARQNLAVSAGVGRLRAVTKQEYLPTIGTSNTLRAEITSVPIHAGAAYYFTPYNQGDFQARAYLGAGFMNVVYNRATMKWDGTGIPAGQAFRWTGTNDGPGYYGEVGAHMFFASKLSVMLSGLYRSNQVRNLVNEDTGAPILNAQGRPVSLDVGGAGFRMAIGIGL